MKTLIINGSPRPHGDTGALISALRERLAGEIVEISAYRNIINPCVDCRSCEKQPGCVIRDDMDIVTDDSYDNIVVASPVYYGILPGPMVSLISRFQFYRSAEHVLKAPVNVTPKRGAAIIVAGSKGNREGALRLSSITLRILGAALTEKDTVLSDITDTVPAKDDTIAIDRIIDLAKRWNEEAQPEQS
jgi:multimeric flavodoxin WrbA